MFLKDALDVRQNPEDFDFFVVDDNHYEGRYRVEFHDESYDMDGTFYLLGMEYGATHLICANNESDAHECWIDLLKPIPMDEIHEAYNAFDKLVDFMVAKGYDNDYQLRRFCSSWAKFYFDADTKDANNTGAWDRWELDEAYQYQSNATDSGIVNVGHYSWMNEITADRITVERKVAVEA
jgi:hypothetical protein